jgi:hypothetical protein
VGLDLPITLGEAFRLEYDFDSRGFAHDPEYGRFSFNRKPYFPSALLLADQTADQASLTDKFVWTHDCDYGFLAIL